METAVLGKVSESQSLTTFRHTTSEVNEDRVNIKPWLWTIWVQRRRAELPLLGYPKQVPWYTKPPLGDLYADPDGGRTYPTDDELRAVDFIEEAVSWVRRRMPTAVRCLEIWEGAFADAHPDRERRLAECGIGYEACKKGASRAKRAIERYMYTGH